MRHVRQALSPASRRAARQHRLPVVALLNVILAGVMGYVVASDLYEILWYDWSPAANARADDARTQVDLAISAAVINVLLDLYLLGVALMLAGSALHRARRAAEVGPVDAAALVLSGGYTWFTWGLMLLLLLKLIIGMALRVADAPIDPAHDLMVLAVTLALAAGATAMALRPIAPRR